MLFSPSWLLLAAGTVKQNHSLAKLVLLNIRYLLEISNLIKSPSWYPDSTVWLNLATQPNIYILILTKCNIQNQ